MASAQRYLQAMRTAGFVEVSATSRNAWYREAAREELERLRGTAGAAAARIVGQEFVDHNIAIWARMCRCSKAASIARRICAPSGRP